MTITADPTTPQAPPIDLVEQQALTLATPRRKAGLVARSRFITMDLLDGRRRTLPKFLVLELVARVPYQTWEHAAYQSITRLAGERAARQPRDQTATTSTGGAVRNSV